ncbi:oligopeptidase A [Glaciecola sp. HTCC2999]|uniref:oligopeptidase A n=1 Tax=Glaciecola sp. HTCC2999 TaxID=455436 RepID=UPI0000E0E43C|nr:oligopeptidase A [Glaciecola sp. HTCC2999]
MSSSVAATWFTDDGLPNFSAIQATDIVAVITAAINDCKAAIEAVVERQDASYAGVFLEIDEVDTQLSNLWSPVSHMNSVLSNDEWREAHDACLPLLSEYGTWVGQHEGLFKLYQTLSESDEFANLDMAQQKMITNTLRDFTLSGIALDAQKKTEYGKIQARLSELSSTFSNQVLDATMAFKKHITDEKMLAGLPDSAKAAAAQLASQNDLAGWLFTLDIPSYLPIMSYADNRELREEMYRAYVTRASEMGPYGGDFDNTAIIEETLSLRTKIANLLGFEHYAQRSIATKMAESTDQVQSFLHDLARQSKPQAQADLAEVNAFAAEHYGRTELQAWDIGYYSEKLKQEKYAISDEQLRPYFPETHVVPGLFEVVSRLYGLKITERKDVDTWHSDVRFFDIVDSDDEYRGSFYLDLYARAKKRGGAWMDECRVKRRKVDGSLQHPVAYLTCNFSGPVDGKPACFTHDEVVTLFHEFGHGIHHMLTKIEVSGVSGINGVAWDAVELPSQFLENWCWQPEALQFISGHVDTGEPLPKALLDKMLAAKNFQSAMQMLRQIEFSLFDFTLHMQTESVDVQAFLNEVRKEISVLTPPEFNRFQNSFGHIFAGGYAAGYYSYKWAEVLSSDAFASFEENGIFDAKTGRRFLESILQMGGSKEPMALFVDFKGREPSVDALLRHSGIAA